MIKQMWDIFLLSLFYISTTTRHTLENRRFLEANSNEKFCGTIRETLYVSVPRLHLWSRIYIISSCVSHMCVFRVYFECLVRFMCNYFTFTLIIHYWLLWFFFSFSFLCLFRILWLYMSFFLLRVMVFITIIMFFFFFLSIIFIFHMIFSRVSPCYCNLLSHFRARSHLIRFHTRSNTLITHKNFFFFFVFFQIHLFPHTQSFIFIFIFFCIFWCSTSCVSYSLSLSYFIEWPLMREYVQGPGGGRLLHTGTQTCTNMKYNYNDQR